MEFLRKLTTIIFTERCPYCRAAINADDIACKSCMKILQQKQRPILRGAMGYRCVSSFLYGGRVRRMIIRMKFHDETQHLRPVSHILAKDIEAYYGKDAFDLITYVPMYKKDLNSREYNQCELLAKELTKRLGIPTEETLLKVKRTKKQHKLSYAERKKNLIGAFQLIDRDRVKDKRILLVDDIITSGYTLGYCCKVLSRAKPALLCCVTIANASTDMDKSAVI